MWSLLIQCPGCKDISLIIALWDSSIEDLDRNVVCHAVLCIIVICAEVNRALDSPWILTYHIHYDWMGNRDWQYLDFYPSPRTRFWMPSPLVLVTILSKFIQEFMNVLSHKIGLQSTVIYPVSQGIMVMSKLFINWQLVGRGEVSTNTLSRSWVPNISRWEFDQGSQDILLVYISGWYVSRDYCSSWMCHFKRLMEKKIWLISSFSLHWIMIWSSSNIYSDQLPLLLVLNSHQVG